MRPGMKLFIAFFAGVLLTMLLMPLMDKFPKEEADAYVCCEPHDEVTFYCKVGTGPPRTDCGAAQNGEFQGVDVKTC